jgi:valyl-tRNA synthetase
VGEVGDPDLSGEPGEGDQPKLSGDLEPVDRWLLSRLCATERAVRAAYDTYNLLEACQQLQRFFWNNVCDWYLEICKSRLQDAERRAVPQWVLLTCFEAFLKMLHPVMPHLTEELYANLPIAGKSDFLMTTSWPELPAEYDDPSVESELDRIFEITVELRSLRATLDIAAMKPIPVAFYEGDLDGGSAIVASQAWVQELKPGRPTGEKFISSTVAGVDLHLPVTGLIDAEKMLADLDRDEKKLAAEKVQVEQRLSNPSFVERAKPEAVEKERIRLADIEARLVSIDQRRELFA